MVDRRRNVSQACQQSQLLDAVQHVQTSAVVLRAGCALPQALRVAASPTRVKTRFKALIFDFASHHNNTTNTSQSLRNQSTFAQPTSTSFESPSSSHGSFAIVKMSDQNGTVDPKAEPKVEASETESVPAVDKAKGKGKAAETPDVMEETEESSAEESGPEEQVRCSRPFHSYSRTCCSHG